MFKKLLSNLPFNPSLIGQLAFYTKRLRKEAAVRRIGVAFLLLALGVQIFAAAVPSEPTLARSGNDVIPGGFRDHGEAVRLCNSNAYNFKVILQRFGVDCLRVFAGKVQTINSRDYGGQLYSMGRLPYGKPGEVSVPISGAGTYYMRPLSSWDTRGSSSYKAIVGTRLDGTPFMILFDCGNLVIVGRPTPPPPPPPPAPPKGVKCANLLMSVSNKSEVAIGTPISLRGQATGKNLAKTELADMYYQYVDAATGRVISEQKARGLPFRNNLAQDSQQRTFTVTKEGRYLFRLTVKYESGKKEATGSRAGNCVKEVTVKKSPPCEDANPNDDVTVCLILRKKAVNTTHQADGGNKTTAKAGDQITYTLSVTNSSTNTPIKDFIVEENITDVLEYADVTDFHGGKINSDNIVKWPPVSIDPGKTVEQKLTVKIKDPIPNTPVPASNPGSFDCAVTNVYGDTVTIELECGLPKTTEQVTTSLPNTGPGETLAVAFVVTTIAGYFFARSRLMVKELEIVKADYATSGGN